MRRTCSQVLLQGAAKIFGVETGLKFKLTKEQIETELTLKLFDKLTASLFISAGYGSSWKDTAFRVKFTINTGLGDVSRRPVLFLCAAGDRKRSISNFPCSLTKNITSRSMKNLAFHRLLRCKMITLPILTTSLIHFLFRRLGECTF